MRKTLSILAIAVFTLGLFSCESETSVAETENLFETLDPDANTGNSKSDDDRN
ncbi:hypothetical protein [Flagellimonas onchidii]|uniref:hypothetical protein n=1 Tax=Flagellimonas onchidii TaxID=2562684 RepID=UPI001455FD60|nr:hypothetical protein [Allomuricauda onchidii]